MSVRRAPQGSDDRVAAGVEMLAERGRRRTAWSFAAGVARRCPARGMRRRPYGGVAAGECGTRGLKGGRRARHRTPGSAPRAERRRAQNGIARYRVVRAGRAGAAGARGSGCRLGDLSGLDAGRTHIEPLGRAAHDRADPLDVRVPAARGAAVRVRNPVAEPRPLTADVADGSHGKRSKWCKEFDRPEGRKHRPWRGTRNRVAQHRPGERIRPA